MSLKRKRSYTIIEIKDPMISSKQILKNAIAKINKNQTIIDFIFSACYYYYFIDRIVSFFRILFFLFSVRESIIFLNFIPAIIFSKNIPP